MSAAPADFPIQNLPLNSLWLPFNLRSKPVAFSSGPADPQCQRTKGKALLSFHFKNIPLRQQKEALYVKECHYCRFLPVIAGIGDTV
jgi:hypothetical protein